MRSAGIVSAATLISRVLGLVREQVTAYLFGAGDLVDAFKSAFRIPNLLRDMFAEGALSAGFVPLFTQKLRSGGREEAIRFAGLVFGALTAVVSAVVIFMIAVTPQIATVIAEGFESVPGKLDATIAMARVMMPFLLLVSLAAMLMGVLNSLGKFFIPALAPALMNVGMIICSIVLAPFVDPPVMSLAIGVLVGGAMQFFIQYLALKKIGFRFPLIFDLANPDLYRLLLLILPTAVGLAATQINVAVITRIASGDSGAVSYLDYAFRLLHLPLGLFAIAIATVALPRLSGEAAAGNDAEFGRIHSSALRLGLFLSLPGTVLMILLAHEICAAVYQYGAFTASDAVNTGRALAMYGIGLPFFTLVRISVPAFYAMRDTRTPALVSILSVAINIVLCFQLQGRLGFAGLALAASLAGLANFALLSFLLHRRTGLAHDAAFYGALLKIAAAAAAMGAAVWATRELVLRELIKSDLHRLLQVVILCAVAAAVFVLMCKILKLEEWTRLWGAVNRKLSRRS